LLKKATPAEIVATIGEVREGGSPMTPQVARRVLDMFKRLSPKPANYDLTERVVSAADRGEESINRLIRGYAGWYYTNACTVLCDDTADLGT
jgi:DNA-binding NarL/FixJ family response regulator